MESSIEKVISEVRDQWMEIDGVEGIGQGKLDEKDCIMVLISIMTSEIEKHIPLEVKGVPVRVIESGILQIQQKQEPEKQDYGC